ncbi:hypothetical protein HXT36_04605 [Gardnerella sp. DNF01144]|uniref:hypothetical protein n=1 Tax=Gardnerella sp. DNF01144 TaxID=2749058 RepID=UPI0003541970|nr:hypothetical protein HMPREF1586_00451 [Gardnerella vaginalis JCP8522]RIY21796.1 hypothetical protein CJI53_00975 [Bifidobacteriaceae bacterium VN002]
MCGVVACFIRFENESFAGDAFMRRPIFFTYHQLRRNEWRDVADAINISIVRFCENVGIDECFLLAMPSFWQNVGIE